MCSEPGYACDGQKRGNLRHLLLAFCSILLTPSTYCSACAEEYPGALQPDWASWPGQGSAFPPAPIPPRTEEDADFARLDADFVSLEEDAVFASLPDLSGVYAHSD